MDSTLEATKEHCAFCFKVLIDTLDRKLQPAWPSSLAAGSCPLFVTWYKGKDEDLRGCIGTFAAGDLKSVLPKYAKIAAFEDTRFDPVSRNEVDKLICGVSFLTNFEEGYKAYDWEVGKHGIIIDFKDPATGTKRNATFLPEVAPELGGDKDVTLKHLISKAGFKGNYKDVVNDIKLTRYQSSKEKLSYFAAVCV